MDWQTVALVILAIIAIAFFVIFEISLLTVYGLHRLAGILTFGDSGKWFWVGFVLLNLMIPFYLIRAIISWPFKRLSGPDAI